MDWRTASKSGTRRSNHHCVRTDNGLFFHPVETEILSQKKGPAETHALYRHNRQSIDPLISI